MGGSGLLGNELVASLRRSGCRVTVYSRVAQNERPDTAYWNPEAGVIDLAALQGADAVVNLCGENLADGRWTPERKRRFRSSRVDVTALLARSLASLEKPPKVLVNASAVGFYGDRGETALDEDRPPGTGFLAELCQAWEAATAPAVGAGMRVVLLRFGVILTPRGGALAAMLGPFRIGLGGRLGSGKQRMPWITLNDAIGVIRFALRHSDLSGPVNAVAPESITNAQFTRALGRALHRASILSVPAIALKLALGEMASEMLLSGANVRPRKLEVAGFRFEYPRIDDALQVLLAGQK